MIEAQIPTRVEQSPHPNPLKLWLAWVLVMPAGAILGVVVMYVLIFAAKVVVPEANEDQLLSIVFLPGLGLATTLGQMLVLHRLISRPWGWMVATVAGWTGSLLALAWVVQNTPPSEIITVMPQFSLAVGLLLGLAQWLYLRRYFYQTGWWLVGSVAGWAVMGLAVGPTFTSILEIALFGLSPAVFSGAVLAWLANKKKA